MDQEALSFSKKGNLIDKLFMHFRILPLSDAFLLKTAILAFFIFALWFLINLSTDSQVAISTEGGVFTEGVIGTPRFINPILAVTRADRDISGLVYDGLMKLGSEGALIPNIAESVTISEDGLTYNIILKDDVYFHDGTKLTSDDVVFTVGRIQEPALTSPFRSNFEGVVAEQISERELNFILPEAYSPFIENLTFGILPRHIWKDASTEEFPFSQHNSEPIGSGPYTVNKIHRNASGIPESYELIPNPSYHLGSPKVGTLILKFYSNEEKLTEAFSKGLIDAFVGVDHKRIAELGIDEKTHTVVTSPLPRTFAVFFNQNKSAALRDKAAREALSVAIDRQELIETVLGGYGEPLTSPIPPGFGVDTSMDTLSENMSGQDAARGILEDAGWELNDETGIWEKEIDDVVTPLSFSIATVNSSVFGETSEYLRTEWERLGVAVTIKQFEQSDLTQAIIRTRDYEALLFGTAVGRVLDFYPFWHSSQRNDPGLNVSLYANITTDSILSKIRSDTNPEEHADSLTRFAEEINKETPAIFLYSPQLLYVFPNNVRGFVYNGLAEPHERFASITEWFIETDSVWPIFTNED